MLRGIVLFLLLLLAVPLGVGCDKGESTKPADSTKSGKGDGKIDAGQPIPPPPPLKKG